MDFGTNMIELRKQYGLTQEELAEKLFVTRQAVSLWEQGKSLPSLDTLRRLRDLYGVSIDEWISNEAADTSVKTKAEHKNKAVITIILIAASLVFLSIIIIGSLIIARRAKLLYPADTKDITITRRSTVLLKKGTSTNVTVAFSEPGKPEVLLCIPDEFSVLPDNSGLYTDENGNYIRVNSDYGKNIFDPLSGTEYSSSFEKSGHGSYIDKLRMAMYTNPRSINVFSSKEDILLAGGARILRNTACAGQNADFYEIDGGLDDKDQMRLSGFLLDFGNGTSLVTVCDSNGNYCYLTIYGMSTEDIKDLLNTIELK